MALHLTYFLLIVFLLFMLYYDVKTRMIHIVLPVLVFCLATLINYISDDLKLSYIIYNTGFVLVNIIGVTLYFSLKSKSLINPIDNSIGLGDIVFFLAITPLFNLKTFILFFIAGLVFSLFVYGITSLFKRVRTIPLAGYLSLFLAINLVIQNVFKVNLCF